MAKKILLTGGGTAGHVTPHLAILPRLRSLGYEIHYAGTTHGIERELIEPSGVAYHPLAAGKLRRYFDFKNLTDLFRIALGFWQALVVIAKVRPDVVFSKGGFVSCPVVWASWFFRIPVVIHESDMTPGLANRLSIPFARRVCYSFPETGAHLPARKGVRTGLPVREQLLSGSAVDGRALCRFTGEKPVLLFMGGSLGSQVINEALRLSLDRFLPLFDIIHLCGKGATVAGQPGYCQFEYVKDELADLFAAADLVVMRAGATTLFELLALRKPNLLIPLATNASRGDQILNARSFENQGLSRVLSQEQLTPETLVEAVVNAHRERRAMIDAMERTGTVDAVTAVVEIIGSAAGGPVTSQS